MKKNIKLIFSIILTLSILLIGGTYAYYVWSTNSENETKIVTEVGKVTVKYDAGASIIGKKLKPVSDKTLGINKNIIIEAEDNVSNKIVFNLYLDIKSLGEGLKHKSFKYAIYKSNTLVKEGNFTKEYLDSNLVTCEKNNTSHIVLLSNEEVTKSLSTYNLYIWIDGANYENPPTMQNQTFDFTLHSDGKNAIIEEAKYPDITKVKEGTLAYKIVNDYINSSKTEVINNSVRYYYDTVHNLMSDVGGNTRYYGANPNNYIYFNCDDYNNQTSDTCELWRIIGVFDDKVKIIRNTSLGNFSWDYDYNKDGEGKTTYNNNWHTSSLQKLLNNQYYNNIDTVYYNHDSSSDTPVRVNANFKTDKTGIKNDTTRNMIAEVNYNLGGWNSSYIYSDEMYEYERGISVYNSERLTSWTGKIALMYPSDYGFGTDFTKCTQYLANYSNNSCNNNDWLFNSNNKWLLTSIFSTVNKVWYVYLSGFVRYNFNDTYNAYEVYPALYLNANTSIEDIGNGSSSSPYQILAS